MVVLYCAFLKGGKMKEKLFLKRFKINGLFGLYNVNIPFDSNINIFVGENGLGKTTILNALNYVIQGDSEGLSTINFESIELTLGNNKTIKILHDDLSANNLSMRNRNYLAHYFHDEDYGYIVRRVMLEVLKENSPKILDDKDSREKLFEKISKKYKYDFPSYVMDRIYNTILKNDEFTKELKKSWEYKLYEYMKEWKQIIYLPTYRRIEEDFNNYIENSPDKEYYRKTKRRNNFSYLQFGMDDVQEAIDNACNTLKNNTNEGFKAMTSNLLTNYIEIDENKNKDLNFKNFDASTLDIVFSRIADKIDPNVKDKIIYMVENKKIDNDKYSKYLLSIINELTNIYEKNKQFDDNIENFKNVCNNYLVNKQIKYDKFRIECKVEQSNGNGEISLKNLSSGEKQILSLFSKLYLNLNDSNIILFDEPELSLSLIWQKKLMPDIINSNRCGFVMAITHSPFIFDNDFKDNTRDIKEYIDFME